MPGQGKPDLPVLPLFRLDFFDVKALNCGGASHFAAAGRRRGELFMQAGFLMVVYVATTVVVQILGFFISEIVGVQWPAAGLTTFLVLFMVAFGVAWPIAVLIAEFAIKKSGAALETEQSAGASQRGHYSRK